MQKPLALSIAVCLGLTGCQVFKRSEAWDKISRVRAGETTRDPDPSNAYAAKLHQALAGSGVEHKVVTYQFRYLTHLREEAVGTRTAVVYRDATNSKYPWWLKDERLSRPYWLPNGDLNKQISFYIHRPAEVLEHKDYAEGGSSGKTVLAAARLAVAPRRAPIFTPRRMVAKMTPAPKVSKPAFHPVIAKAPVSKPVPHKAPIVLHAPAQPQPKKPYTAKRVIAKAPTAKSREKQPIAKPATASAAVAAKKPAAKVHFRSSAPSLDRTAASETSPPPIASHSPAPWTAPTDLVPGQRPKGIVHVDEHLEKLFREETGTDYNPASPADRRKMEKLRRKTAALD